MATTGQNPGNLDEGRVVLRTCVGKALDFETQEMALEFKKRLDEQKDQEIQESIQQCKGKNDERDHLLDENGLNEKIINENGSKFEGKQRFSKKQNKKQLGFNTTITKSCQSFPQQDQILQNQSQYQTLGRLDRSTIIQLNFSLQPLKREPSKKQIKEIVEKMKVEKLEKSKSQKRLLDEKIMEYQRFINQIIEENDKLKGETKQSKQDIFLLDQQIQQLKKILAEEVQAKSVMAHERDSLLAELKQILEVNHQEQITLRNTIASQVQQIQQFQKRCGSLNQILQSLTAQKKTLQDKMVQLERKIKAFEQSQKNKNREILDMKNCIDTSQSQVQILAERLSQKQNQLDIQISLREQSSSLLKDREGQISSLNNQIQSQKQQFDHFRALYYKSKEVFERNNSEYKQRIMSLEKENDSYRQIIVSLNSTNEGLLKRLKQIDNSWIQDREQVLLQLQTKRSYSQNYIEILSMFDIRPGKMSQQKLLTQICQLRNSIVKLLKKIEDLQFKVKDTKQQNSRLIRVIEEQEQDRYVPELQNIVIQQNEEILKQKLRIYNLFIQQKN